MKKPGFLVKILFRVKIKVNKVLTKNLFFGLFSNFKEAHFKKYVTKTVIKTNASILLTFATQSAEITYLTLKNYLKDWIQRLQMICQVNKPVAIAAIEITTNWSNLNF